jgi:hypothetical protein
MGAYENPPMITFQTSGAGQAWAQAAAGIGKNIGNAIIERKKKLDADLEKENKEMLEIAKQRELLAAQGAEKLKANLEKMEGLDESFRQAYIKEFNTGWDAFTNSQTARTPEEVAKYGAALKKFNAFKANGPLQIQAANDFIIGLAKGLDEVTVDGPAVPGGVDMYYGGNNNYMRAANIEAGGIEADKGETRTVEIDGKGNAVIKYTLAKEDGKLETFEINMGDVDLDSIFRVPDAKNILKSKVDATGIYVGEGKDRTISTEYLPTDPVTGKPAQATSSEVYTDPQSGKRMLRIKQGPAIQANDIAQIYTDQMLSAKLSDDQKVSIWKNTLNGMIKEVEIGTGKLDKNGNEITEKVPFSISDLNFNNKGATQLDERQQKLYNAAISQFAGIQASNDIQTISKELGGSEKLIDMPKDDLSNNYKNTRYEFTKLIKGDQETLAISTSTYFAKDASGNWNVFTVGSQFGSPKQRYETGKANVIDLVADLPASFNIDKEALIKELQLVN